VAPSELEVLEWAVEVVVKCMWWVVMIAVVLLEALCPWQAGAWGLAMERGRAPLPSQILGVALVQEHLTQTVV
jgi:hypothetical protein